MLPRLASAFAALSIGPALTAGISILGTWKIVEAVPAPWSAPEEKNALATAGKRMLNTEVTFAAGSVKCV